MKSLLEKILKKLLKKIFRVGMKEIDKALEPGKDAEQVKKDVLKSISKPKP